MAQILPQHLNGTSSGHPITILTQDLAPKLPAHCSLLFARKKEKNLSFEAIGKAMGRDEIMAAALFYGQAQANEADIAALSSLLDIPAPTLRQTELGSIPDRGRTLEMPPREPLMYRLYEIVQNYGYAFKGVINEKFGDGIMSAISFTAKVEKDTDEKGEWVKITLRGKWYVARYFIASPNINELVNTPRPEMVSISQLTAF